MGQRLNLEITNDGLSLVNCYFHWSAYTDSAAEITHQFIHNYNEEVLCKKELIRRSINNEVNQNFDISSLNRLVLTITALEQLGAKLNDNDLEIYNTIIANQTIKKKENNGLNRNNGIISFSQSEKETTRDWEEGRVTVDLDNMIISFDVLCYYSEDFDDDLEFIHELEESNQIKEDNLDTSYMTEDDLDDLIETLTNYRMIKTQDGYLAKVE